MVCVVVIRSRSYCCTSVSSRAKQIEGIISITATVVTQTQTGFPHDVQQLIVRVSAGPADGMYGFSGDHRTVVLQDLLRTRTHSKIAAG